MPRRHVYSLKDLKNNIRALQFSEWNGAVIGELKEKLEKVGTYKGFRLVDDRIFYRYKDRKKYFMDYDLELVPRGEIPERLRLLWYDPKFGLRGPRTFYEKIKRRYIGITFRDIVKFLRKQEAYQRTIRPFKPVQVQPITASAPFQRWQIDLFDMKKVRGSNRKKAFVLVVVDVFSKYVYIQPVTRKATGEIQMVNVKFKEIPNGETEEVYLNDEDTKKTNVERVDAKNLAEAFEKIWNEVERKFGYRVYPHIVQSDNELSFIKLFKNNPWGIKHILSSSYKPTSQGHIERMNQTVKNILRKHFIACDTKQFVDRLPDIAENINNTPNRFTGFPPRLLHYPNDELVDRDRVIREVASKIRDRTAAIKENRKTGEEAIVKGELVPGAKVRVTEWALTQKKLQSKKQAVGESKAFLKPQWSDEIYEIKEIKGGKVILKEFPNKTFDPNQLQVLPLQPVIQVVYKPVCEEGKCNRKKEEEAEQEEERAEEKKSESEEKRKAQKPPAPPPSRPRTRSQHPTISEELTDEEVSRIVEAFTTREEFANFYGPIDQNLLSAYLEGRADVNRSPVFTENKNYIGILEDGVHFATFRIQPVTKKALLIDSMKEPLSGTKNLADYLRSRGFEVKVQADDRQMDSKSCGVFAAQNAIDLLKNRKRFGIPDQALFDKAEELIAKRGRRTTSTRTAFESLNAEYYEDYLRLLREKGMKTPQLISKSPEKIIEWLKENKQWENFKTWVEKVQNNEPFWNWWLGLTDEEKNVHIVQYASTHGIPFITANKSLKSNLERLRKARRFESFFEFKAINYKP